MTDAETEVRALVAGHPDATLDELCELWGQQTGKWVSRTALCRYLQKLGLNRKKKPGTVAFAGTERVQKLRVEFWEKIREFEAKNLVFLDETGIMRSFGEKSCPFSVGDKSKRNQTLLSRRKSHSHWRN